MNSILVSLLDNLGDVIMSTAAIRLLRDAYPSARIDVLVRPETAEALYGNPAIDNVVIWAYRSKSTFYGLRDIVRRVRENRYEVYLSLDRRPRSALLAVLARIPVRIGPHILFYGSKSKWWPRFAYTRVIPMDLEECANTTEMLRLVVRRAFNLEGSPPVERLTIPDASRVKANALLACADRPVIGLSVRANFPLKTWPAERFAELMKRLKRNLGAFLYVTGAPSDREYVEKLIEMCPEAVALNLSGQTSILDTAALAAASDLFITLDTGTAHIVGHSGLEKIVVVFCCTSPVVVEDSLPQASFVRVEEPCCPCQHVRPHECPNPPCMTKVTVDMVYDEAVRLLEQKQGKAV